MQWIFSILFMFSLFMAIAGIIKPSFVIRWGEKRTRGRSLLVYGTATFIFLLGIIITAPSPHSAELANGKEAASQSQATVLEIKPGDTFYLDEKTVFAKSSDDLLQFLDLSKANKTPEIMKLKDAGKIFIIHKKTAVNIASPTTDKEITAIIVREGEYDLQEGYTFTKWLTK